MQYKKIVITTIFLNLTFCSAYRQFLAVKSIFDSNDMMVSRMLVSPIESDCMLVILSLFDARGKSKHQDSLHFYILNNKGSIVNNAVFHNMSIDPNFIVTVFKDKMFLVTTGQPQQKEGKIEIPAKLICFKIEP